MAPKKRARAGSDDEDQQSGNDSSIDASQLSNTPPNAKKQKKESAAKRPTTEALHDIENDSILELEPKPKKTKTSTEQYQKLTQLEHIIKRPDTYIGSVEKTETTMWVFNSENKEMESRKVTFVPGLYKIFDEIMVNAADNKQNDANMKNIKVVVDREKGEISVENDGRGIPVEIHEVSNLVLVVLIPVSQRPETTAEFRQISCTAHISKPLTCYRFFLFEMNGLIQLSAYPFSVVTC